MNKKRVYEVLAWASSFLEKNGRDPHLAKILLYHHLQVDGHTYPMIVREMVEEATYEKIKHDLHLHASSGMPVQHIIGYEYFYGRKFQVNEDVLIPRFETEELVEHVIELVEEHYQDSLRIVDVGTGSSAIATTLALELPQAEVYATDISEAALQVAKENAASLGANVSFMQGNFLQPILEASITPQIIVSNPPYIARAEMDQLEDTVRNFDPHLALFAENDGLFAYEEIIRQSKALSSVKHLAFEIGYEQADAVTSIVQAAYSKAKLKTIRDINGKDRIISALLP